MMASIRDVENHLTVPRTGGTVVDVVVTRPVSRSSDTIETAIDGLANVSDGLLRTAVLLSLQMITTFQHRI